MKNTSLPYLIETLKNHHDKKSFACGINELDRYLQQNASQEEKRHISATFVLIEKTTNNIVGYYTLSSTSILTSDLPTEITKKLPKYPLLPATLLGRLAIDKRYQGKKFGELLLIDALKKSLDTSQTIGSMAVIVDAKNEQAIKFYKYYNFMQFPKCPNKLFLPMKTIKEILK